MNKIEKLINATDVSMFGGKAANLAILLQNNLPVPDGIAVGVNAFDDSGKLLGECSAQICEKINSKKLYAVRSSALAEDAKGASWAGQFESFLNTKFDDVIEKVEQCHNSAKNRAKAYAQDKGTQAFNVAVVVQEMIKPEYAGVLFTKDPMTGEDKLVTEYVEGLGESLVSGEADPKHAVLDGIATDDMPFDNQDLFNMAKNVEQIFGVPQDIEWAWENGKTWLVQARPITSTQISRSGYYLGEPSDLFYWGPSRAKAMYMSDFMMAVKQFLTDMSSDSSLPKPPKTLVLFNEGKMVWLNNAQAFSDFTEKTFEAYIVQDRVNDDYDKWQKAASGIETLVGAELNDKLVEAWYYTEFGEFALYGASASLLKTLNRFDPRIRQDIWGAFMVPDKLTFSESIDAELATNKNPAEMAKKYPWIKDGYSGLGENVQQHFEERLEIVGDEVVQVKDNEAKRSEMATTYKLTEYEVNALAIARKLSEFMDARKMWMMQTRKLITNLIGDIEYGWLFDSGKSVKINQDDTRELWDRYVEFKASSMAVEGIVASNGGKHYLNGEVVVVGSPTDSIEDDKIIVVPSTSPSYVPLMRKARALVTDHGGMMSHAAIVAREFNLPCIVGTKQATKILHTGDKVVLDLVKGEVIR